ncbi:MAG TPA: prohibitin family protein [Candidatus Bathyarchaeota archaeon]|nr:prohibitin family protein [Candidatus Bathyarchaeota archaeon]
MGYFRDRVDIPDVPLGARRMATLVVILIILGASGVVVATTSVVRVPSGYRGVLLTWGKVEDRILQEGLNFKIPFSQTVVLMNVQIQKTESVESTATKDLQEVSTTVAVNYRLDPLYVNEIYKELRQDYVNRVIKPNIEESLKATTAMFRAEELITKRSVVKQTFDSILEERLSKFHIQVVAVSLTDFQFSESFSAAIEAKVTAEQQALVAKNELERIRYEAQQQIIQAEAEKNATIRRAEGEAVSKIIAANATARTIEIITSRLTDEYLEYLLVEKWDGRLPLVITRDENGILISLGEMFNTTGN